MIDVGGYVPQTLHTPGHRSGAICLCEPSYQILFTGDTLFANGSLGATPIFPSGNISDYIDALRHLASMKISIDPAGDFQRAILGSMNLMKDTRSLFTALNSQSEFQDIMKSIAAYSRQVLRSGGYSCGGSRHAPTRRGCRLQSRRAPAERDLPHQHTSNTGVDFEPGMMYNGRISTQIAGL